MSKIEYYELVKQTYEVHPRQLVTAAVRSCSLCNDIISGMGGPGHGSICIPCGDDIKNRKLAYFRNNDMQSKASELTKSAQEYMKNNLKELDK